MDKWVDLLSGIVMVALVTTIVSHKYTAQVFSAGSKGFSESLRAAQGK